MLERLPGASTSFTPLLQSSAQAMPFDASRFGLLRPRRSDARAAPERPAAYFLAARIQGPAKSAFAEGIEGHREGLKEARATSMSSSWPIPTCSAIACGSRCRTSSASVCRSPEPTTARWWSTRWTTCRAPTR
ncbi:hypothetical protein ACPA9J_32800 [Pseudomonas aeruginosa]